ncbi:MAG TPA: LPS export ABC transporter permease LptF [Stellaceae bacterium]|nr:LPS export ABC transporter permease LptF [Stellaceae bacterium]
MKGLTRYMLRQTLLVMLSVCLVFSSAVWLVQALRLIDLIVNRGLSVGVFLHLAILIMPRFIDVVLPIAVFVAALFVYNKLTAESEMVVMRAAGISPMSLAAPALATGVIGTIILYSLSLYLLPASNRAFKDLQFEIRNRFASVLIQDGVFNTLTDKLMVYVQGRDDNGDLNSILIYDSRTPDKPVTVFAERGALANASDGPRLLLLNGTRQQRDETNGHLSVLTFKQYTLELTNLTGAPGMRDRQVDERYTGDLLNNLGPDQDADWRRAVLVELNMRLAGPLSALTLAAISVACLLTGEFNRRGQTKRVLLAVGLAFVVEVIDVALKDLAARAWFAIPLLYANLLVPLLIALWMLWRESAPSWRRRGIAAQPAE